MNTKYVNELKKDIKIIKKDIRSMNIKTRTIFKELEKNNFTITTIKKSPKVIKKVWWKKLINKVFGTKW